MKNRDVVFKDVKKYFFCIFSILKLETDNFLVKKTKNNPIKIQIKLKHNDFYIARG